MIYQLSSKTAVIISLSKLFLFVFSMTELEKDINNLRSGLKSVETVSDVLCIVKKVQLDKCWLHKTLLGKVCTKLEGLFEGCIDVEC